MKIFEIEPGLFQSTKIDDPNQLSIVGIEVVIDLEGGFDNEDIAFYLHQYVYWHILDLPFLPNREDLWRVARFGYDAWKFGKRVLVHCTMGRNRSGLINGCILWLNGMTGEDAVRLIQEKRPGALSNPVFASYLKTLT